jgi:putative transposase
MPWRERLPVDLRVQFISEFQSELWSMTELAAQYGISRKTGYKWVERYTTGGAAALSDRSRRPQGHPRATEQAVVEALLVVRRRHPRWGAKKLLAVVRRADPDATWPGRSTVCDLLRREGLIGSRPRRASMPHGSHTLAPITAANDTWTTDFKGEFRTGDRRYCYPLTLRDGFSRYVLGCEALLSRSYALTRPCFERAFAAYGLPLRIRSDNGGPFAGPGLGRLSRLNVWWIRLGIIPERIALGRPAQNGSHEQFHRILKADTTRPPAATARAQQRRFRAFSREYNEDRPHEGLHDDVPARHYHASNRALPTRLLAFAYPGHMEVRLVSSSGEIAWRGAPVFLTEVLAGEHVGLEEVDDGYWTLSFASIVLGRFDERTRTITALPPRPAAV